MPKNRLRPQKPLPPQGLKQRAKWQLKHRLMQPHRPSKEALESASGRIGDLEGQISELTAQGTDLQAQIQEKEQALADLNTQYAAAQGDVATAQTRLQELDTQLEGYVAEFADPEDAAIPAEAAPEAPAAEGSVEGSEAEAPAPAKLTVMAELPGLWSCPPAA